MNIVKQSCARGGCTVTRALLSALVVSGALSAAVVPASAATRKPITFSRKADVRRGVLTSGNTVVVKGTVTNPVGRVSSWWTIKTVENVVRFGVNGRYIRPYRSQGYRCVPTVKRRTASYVCKIRGADVPTSVRLKFTVTYRGRSVGSGVPSATHAAIFTVLNLPAGREVLVSFSDAVIDPFQIAPDVTFAATGPSSLQLNTNGAAIFATSLLNSAKLTTDVTTRPVDATAITGTAIVPNGANLYLNIDGHGHAISDGDFSVPLS